MNLKKQLLPALCALLVLSGCTSVKLYSGERPDNEIAVISLNHAVMILRINGKKTPRILQQAGYNFSEGRTVRLLPGDYTATCRLFNEGWETIGDFDFPFSVKAGKRYYMTATGNGRDRMGVMLREIK